MQQRIFGHATVPQFLEETVEVVVASTELVQQRIVEHATAPVPHIAEQTVDVPQDVDAAILRIEKWMRVCQGHCAVNDLSVLFWRYSRLERIAENA